MQYLIHINAYMACFTNTNTNTNIFISHRFLKQITLANSY